eukprot:165838_1
MQDFNSNDLEDNNYINSNNINTNNINNNTSPKKRGRSGDDGNGNANKKRRLNSNSKYPIKRGIKCTCTPLVTQEGDDVHPLHQLLEAMKQVQPNGTINMAFAYFSDPTVIEEVSDLIKTKNINLNLIIGHDCIINSSYEQATQKWKELSEKHPSHVKIKVRLRDRGGIMHWKYVEIPCNYKYTYYVGGWQPTRSGSNNNDENGVLLDINTQEETYTNKFNKMWNNNNCIKLSD